MAAAPRRLFRSPAASRDLIDIWKYIAKSSSHEAADGVLYEINRAAQRLTEHPFFGRPRNDIAAGLRSVLVRSHLVIYSVTDAAIEIIRVLHERRDISAALAKGATP